MAGEADCARTGEKSDSRELTQVNQKPRARRRGLGKNRVALLNNTSNVAPAELMSCLWGTIPRKWNLGHHQSSSPTIDPLGHNVGQHDNVTCLAKLPG